MMKKLFFFKPSNNGSNRTGSPQWSDNQVNREIPPKCEMSSSMDDISDKSSHSSNGLFTKSCNRVSDERSPSSDSGLRRSTSMSSITCLVDVSEEKNNSSANRKNLHLATDTENPLVKSLPQRPVSPFERQQKVKNSPVKAMQSFDAPERPVSSASSKSQYELSGGSACSNGTAKVVDRYIDGEQQPDINQPKKFPVINGRLPPRFRHSSPNAFTKIAERKSWNFKEQKNRYSNNSSVRNWMENDYGRHPSPRIIAKNVVEKLSESYTLPNGSSKEFGREGPITIEDVYSGSTDKCYDVNVDIPSLTSYPSEQSKDYDGFPFSALKNKNFFRISSSGMMFNYNDDAEDEEVNQMSKEAEDRAVRLSEELDMETFLPSNEDDVPSLIRTLREITEDKVSLAIEISDLWKNRISDRLSAVHKLTSFKEELDSRTVRLEKEKSELRTALEKELDRRSSEWSNKLEKYKLEEQRLRERVRELAEQNVSLQKEISTSSEREVENENVITSTEQQLGLANARNEELNEENKRVKEELLELQKDFDELEDQLKSVKRNLEEKDRECKDQQKSIARILRIHNEQEKTIEGLRDMLSEESDKPFSRQNQDKQLTKLQMEHVRLTGVELTLRKEIESCRAEIDSLRRENINLLKRLKIKANEDGSLGIKFENEMSNQVSCLQKQSITLLAESVGLCSLLLEHLKENFCRNSELKKDTLSGHGVDSQFLFQSETKVQGFKRRIESLTRSLQTISSLIQEKKEHSEPLTPRSCATGDLSQMTKCWNIEDDLKHELKLETLLRNLLKDKLYSKELEIEHLQADLAAVARGNDILRCEVQNALDNLSCVSHSLKDTELQMLKKDESIYQLQVELQNCNKELAIMKGLLPKISSERDLMWEEVKQYNEQNMLLNSEVNSLKKKIEALDEDILLKEGQISILKDTIGSRPFDLLCTPDTPEFLLK